MKIGRWACLSVLAASVGTVQPIYAANIYVAAGNDLQQALNDAQPGDVILLAQGAEFVGNFVLPEKTGDGWITLRTSIPDTVLPAEGVRILPEYSPLLAVLRSPTIDVAALRTAPRAHHWNIRYVEFGGNPWGAGDIIQLGDGSAAQNTSDLVPHHFILRHVYVHGDAALGQKRCIALNAADVIIADSYVSDCKSTSQDSQAIGGWNGPGPFTIENNYLEGAGENVMFGGANPSIPNLVPSNIVFRRNLVSRPMSWRDPIIPTPEGVAAAVETGGSLAAGVYAYRVVARGLVGRNTTGQSTASTEVVATVSDPGGAVRVRWDPVPGAIEYRVYGRTSGTQTIYWRVTETEYVDTGAAGTSSAVPTGHGTTWLVKNLFELKNASQVLVEDNIFENHWQDGQAGWALVVTPRNDGACTWCIVEHVQFRYNLVRNVAGGVNMLGHDSPAVTRQTNNIDIQQNLFLMTTALGGPAWFMQLGDEPRDVRVHHNTIDSNGTTVVYAYGGSCSTPRQILGFEYVANAARYRTYGINSPCGTGSPTLVAYYPGVLFLTNYLAGAQASRYPPGTIVVMPFEAQFTDVAGGIYTVLEGSPLKRGALDASGSPVDIGVDFEGLVARVAGVRNPSAPELPTRPTAGFTLTCTYLDCAFADQSSAGSAALTTRYWSFGDGTSGSDASGTHTFAAGGTYTIRLTVTDANGLEDSRLLTATVRPPNVVPTAAFDAACVDLICAFTNRSGDADGSLVAHAWTFGAAGVSADVSPSFKFPAPGTYQVTLVVTDDEGATATVTIPVAVRAVIHAAFVDAVITGNGSGKSSWNVQATVAVHGADERLVAGATIVAIWSGPQTKNISCVTAANGTCSFASGTLGSSRTSITLTLLSVSAPLSGYQQASNHDRQGAPTGGSATYLKP
jgi:PKD repeat protein